jgi:hypothetical protein
MFADTLNLAIQTKIFTTPNQEYRDEKREGRAYFSSK